MTSEDGGRGAAGADLPAGRHVSGEPDEWGAEPPSVPRPRTPPPAEHLGPDLLDEDTWETIEPDPTGETYQGRRRANLPSRRRSLLVALIIAGLAAVVLIPLTMTSLLGVNDAAGPATTEPVVPPAEGGPLEPPVLTPDSPPPTSITVTPATTAPPPPRTTRRARPTTTSRPPNPPPPQPFGPVSVEAEGSSVTRGGSAIVWDYDDASGGRIVGRIGDWDQPQGPGSVRFNDVAIPTNGTYTIRIHYVHVDGERDRTGIVSVSGIDPITTSFRGSSDCCDVKTLTVTLGAGSHTITISNPGGHGPAIDRIVISRP